MSVTDLDPRLAAAALEALPAAAAVFDAHGVMICRNGVWTQDRHPCDPGELYARCAEPDVAAALQYFLAGGDELATIDHSGDRDGRTLWWRTRIKRFEVDGQQAVLVTHKDITEFKDTERTLALREAQYRGVVDDQVEMICRFRPDTTLTFVNASYCRYFGYPREELLGRKFLDYVPEAEHATILNGLARLSPDEPSRSYTHEVRRSDGSTGWHFWTDRALFDERGTLVEFQSVGLDVTGHRQAEAARARSEERFRELAEAVPEVFWVFDWQKRCIDYVSPAFADVTGRTTDELLGDASVWINAVHPEDRDRVNKAFRHADTTPYDQRYRIVRPDGQTRWLRDRGQAVTDDAGRVLRIVGIAEDITSQVEATERLRRSEDRYRAALDGALDAFFLLEAVRDDDGQIDDFVFVDMNAPAAAMISRPRDQVVGQKVCEMMPLHRETGLFERYARVTESRVPVMAEFELDAEDQGVVPTWIQHQVIPVGDGVAITARDITERKQAEHRIAELYEQTQLILDSVPAYIFYKDAHKRMLRVNRAAAESMGLPADQIEGRKTEEFFPDQADEYFRDDQAVMRSGVPKLGYVESYDVPGKGTRFVQTDKVPVFDEAGRATGVIAIATDVTEQRRAELDRAVLEKAEEERQQIGRELHDGIGQQITGLRMLLEGARRKTARGEALNLNTVDELARIVTEANAEVRRLISGLTPDPIAAEELPASLNSIAANLMTFFRVRARARCDDVPDALTDEQADHLLRIAQEACHNAAKHARAGQVEITLECTAANLRLTVVDDGQGLGESGPARAGSGRGLRIMRHRADMIRGRFEIQSAPQGGTRVDVAVPLEPDR